MKTLNDLVIGDEAVIEAYNGLAVKKITVIDDSFIKVRGHGSFYKKVNGNNFIGGPYMETIHVPRPGEIEGIRLNEARLEVAYFLGDFDFSDFDRVTLDRLKAIVDEALGEVK